MNSSKRTLLLPAIAWAIIACAGCTDSHEHDERDDHAGHDHASEPAADGGHDEGSADEHDREEHAESDSHGDAGDEHGEHDEHEEDLVRLTPEQLEQAGVGIVPLASGTIATHVMLPAEVGLNLDAVVHVTPRAAGIVTEVHGLLGAEVEPGDLLAVIESSQLGEAKIDFLQAVQREAIAQVALDRQRIISEGTADLLDLLRGEPELDALREASSVLNIGENKSRLLSAYAKVRAARANHARERELREQNLSTESDLLAAEEEMHSSQAQYFGAFEEIDFAHRLQLQEAEQAAAVAASEAANAARRLRLLGLDTTGIERITREPETHAARSELRAPSAGRIVAKHITPGEMLGSDQPVYTIADLRTVWLSIAVYTHYADLIVPGQQVTVSAGEHTAAGTVDYLSALVDEATRTISARVVLDNSDGRWKPGAFVTARVETANAPAARVVPIEAIQTFEGRQVVFVQDDEGIRPVAVELGRRSDTAVELLGDDIAIGTPIVVRNSFLMKAELGKGAAGHDH